MIVVSVETDPNQKWRAAGQTFAVQSMRVSLQKGVTLRIEPPGEKTPVVVPGASFEVVDGSKPDCWEVGEFTNHAFSVGPRVWQELGFWDRLFDDDPQALDAYAKFRTPLNEDAVDEPFAQFATVRTIAEIPGSPIPIGTIGVVLEVHSEPALSYELEIVDSDGTSLFSGGVDPSLIALVDT